MEAMFMYEKFIVCRRSMWSRSLKERNVFSRSNTGNVGSVHKYVRMFSLFMSRSVGSGLATGLWPVRGVMPTICKIHNFIINSERELVREHDPSR